MNVFIHSFIQQYLFIINPVPSTVVEAGSTDAISVLKETDQMLTTPLPTSAGHNQTTFPSLPCNYVVM